MIEFLKHFFGFCGEPHPSVLTLIVTPPFIYIYYKIKDKLK